MDANGNPVLKKTLVYSREELLALRDRASIGIRHPIPDDLKRRYRGCRAGAKLKARQQHNDSREGEDGKPEPADKESESTAGSDSEVMETE